MVLLALFHCSYRLLVLPIPSSTSPQRAMKCLSHSRLQYVFIDSRVRTLCVHFWECTRVDGCFEVTLPKTRTLSPMTHLHYWTRWPGELTSPVLRPRVTASSDLTTILVWEQSARDCLSCRSLKVTASSPHFLSTGRSKYVALHLKTKLFREPGTAQLLSLLSYPQTHTVIHSLWVSIYTCINSLSCSSLEDIQRSCSHQCPRTHVQTHACTRTGLRPSCC